VTFKPGRSPTLWDKANPAAVASSTIHVPLIYMSQSRLRSALFDYRRVFVSGFGNG
jgi:hypothetical protein